VLLDAGLRVSFKKRFTGYVKVTNLLGEDVQRLDDALTTLAGAPVFRVGLKLMF
jgi:hypothetical protein